MYGDDGIPDDDSWVWEWFPGGRRWKALIKKWGTRAVEEMAREGRGSMSGSTKGETSMSVEETSTSAFVSNKGTLDGDGDAREYRLDSICVSELFWNGIEIVEGSYFVPT